MFIKICSLKKENNTWSLYDCCNPNNNLGNPYSWKKRFPPTMNTHYRDYRKGILDGDNPNVWVLKGKDKIDESTLQVGRTKNLERLLSHDIKGDIYDFFLKNMNNKYGKLKVSKYDELTFYEVDIEEYLKDDTTFISMYKKCPSDEDLKSAYLLIRAAYVEGKIACKECNGRDSMYTPSTLDGCYYAYWKKQKLKATGTGTMG